MREMDRQRMRDRQAYNKVQTKPGSHKQAGRHIETHKHKQACTAGQIHTDRQTDAGTETLSDRPNIHA